MSNKEEDRFKTFFVRKECFDDLTKEEQVSVSENGYGKEFANYLRVIVNGVTIALESDAMEPEDATFGRDMDWIAPLLREVYQYGYNHGTEDADVYPY